MRLMKTGTLLSMTLAATVSLLDNSRIASAANIDPQDYATEEMGSADWSAAEAALLGINVAEEDKVFAKLNLAFVYSSTGRRDLAISLYNEVLQEDKNPYALTASGKPRRVKSIARLALASLKEN
ncbi:hypothetical protein [Kordiimonas aquimaris]|uniref:hypothetical protein n=1 Tax=Kordiimonas aquimaris TaxID=707591 RepID=UPI0021CEE2E0|nr:hypothetical protein [Kordiimonas aquimaris]